METKRNLLVTSIGCLLAAGAFAASPDASTSAGTPSAGANHASTTSGAYDAGSRSGESATTSTNDGTQGSSTNDASRDASTQGASQANSGERNSSHPERVASATEHTPTPLVLLMVPVQQPRTTQTAMDNGCWAKLYSRRGYGGDSMTLVGPVDMPTMTGPFGFNWANQVRSLRTGPRATVKIFDNERYRDRDATIQPGRSVTDLEDQKLGFFDDFRSMKISCANPPPASS